MRLDFEDKYRKQLFKDWKSIAFYVDKICDLTQKKDLTEKDIEDYEKRIELLKERIEEMDGITRKLLKRWKNKKDK